MTKQGDNIRRITVSAPGRICLFGEHLDYLHLPVIPAAINLRLTITGSRRADKTMRFHLPDIHGDKSFNLPAPGQVLTYDGERDYYKSAYNVLSRLGFTLDSGWDCTVTSRIPINSGTSSSSALTVAWTCFLFLAAKSKASDAMDPGFVGQVAYQAEVEEFAEAGGMMDQMASAMGGVMRLDFTDPLGVSRIDNVFGAFVLGDSGEAKDTQSVLGRTKISILDAVATIKADDPHFSLASAATDSLSRHKDKITAHQYEVLHGACENRDILEDATRLLRSGNFDHRLFGEMLSEHHRILDEALNISTTKINLMLAEAITAGAYGGKINGSGGGGCMFVYAPENTAKIARAIEKVGGRAYIVHIDAGVRGEAEPA